MRDIGLLLEAFLASGGKMREELAAQERVQQSLLSTATKMKQFRDYKALLFRLLLLRPPHRYSHLLFFSLSSSCRTVWRCCRKISRT